MNAIKKVLSGDSDKHTSTDSRQSLDSASRGGMETANSARAPTSPTSSRGIDGGNEGSRLPVQSGVTGRSEETDRAARTVGGRSTGDFTDPHTHGHTHDSKVANEFDPKGATTTHSHTHLGHKTHETRHEHEVEEVERVKDHERHVTHVQHHVQPVKDTEHRAEVHHQRAIPQTHIEERHVSSDTDKKAFAGLGAAHKDTVQHGGKERTVVDLGEKVNETVHHHVHNVVQPIIHKDTHDHHRIHTVIPTHHVTHEAPIVHQSVEHGMLSKDDFMKQGGQLGSNIHHDQANVLATGDCERNVDGVGEKLAKELNLKQGTLSGQHKADTRI